MFKKVLQSISKSLGKAAEPAAKPAPAPAPNKAKAAPAPVAPAPEPAKKVEAPKPKAAPKTPDELCGIEPKMNKEAIRDRLKLLYRRHNRAASSLEAKTREEAEIMLDAIVQVREKTFGEI